MVRLVREQSVLLLEEMPISGEITALGHDILHAEGYKHLSKDIRLGDDLPE